MSNHPQDQGSASDFIRLLNEHAPPALETLGGHVVSFDVDSSKIEMHYDADQSMCHSGDVVQGGFVTGMLDAAMAHATFCALGKVIALASLEIKVSFLEVTRPGKLIARGQVIRMGKTTCFLEADLYDDSGRRLARATSTARIFNDAPLL